MMIQQKINYNKNKNRVGNLEKVIVDVSNESGWSLARSYMDAPEVDNYVKINEQLEVGEFYNIKVTKAYEYDVEGELFN